MNKTHDLLEQLIFGYALLGVMVWSELAAMPFRVTASVMRSHCVANQKSL